MRLPELVRPVLPRLSAAELRCLPPEVYRKLVYRDRLRKDYAERLEAIIRGYNGTPASNPLVRGVRAR